MILIRILVFWLILATNTFAQITTAPSCPVLADPWHSQAGLLVQKRDISTYCVFCFQPAACVSGSDGYIGCCTAIGTTCAPRTECTDYTSGITASCDYVTGGCIYCSQTNRPFCVKTYQGDNYIFSCGTKKLTTTYFDSGIGAFTALPSAAPTTNSQPIETTASSDPSTSMSSSVSSASSTSPLAASPSSSTSTSASTPAPAQSGSMASSRGLIIGVIVGAAAGSILLLVLLFIVWKCWKRRRSDAGRVSKEKSNQAGYSLGSGEDSNTEQISSQHDMDSGLSSSQGPAELEEQSHHPTNHNTVNEHPYSPEHVRGAAEAPSNAPVWSSPSIAMTSPTPSNSSLWMTTPGMGT
ncbi:hypothetical protein E4T44_11571, partial [Aureobasidium sp. EXF-8845]